MVTIHYEKLLQEVKVPMVLLEDKIKITMQHSASQRFVWIAWHSHLQKLLYKCKIPNMLESKSFKLARLYQIVQSEDNQIQYPQLIDKKLDNS